MIPTIQQSHARKHDSQGRTETSRAVRAERRGELPPTDQNHQRSTSHLRSDHSQSVSQSFTLSITPIARCSTRLRTTRRPRWEERIPLDWSSSGELIACSHSSWCVPQISRVMVFGGAPVSLQPQLQMLQMDHNHQHSFQQVQQPSLSPTDFFNGLDLTPPVQPGPRSYKSRKYRPCDFCRARQVACKIDITPPCQLCASHGRQCTFVERPKKKRRPNASISNGDSNSGMLHRLQMRHGAMC